MKCKKCGEELPDRAQFCLICGTPVESSVDGDAMPNGEEPEQDAASADDAPEPAAEPASDSDATREYQVEADEMPATKKLEEPLEPAAVGAVPLVPLAPPPRATRIRPRAPRPYAAHAARSPYSDRRVSDGPAWPASHAARETSEPKVEAKEKREKGPDRAPASSASEHTEKLSTESREGNVATDLVNNLRERAKSMGASRDRLFVIAAFAAAAAIIAVFLGVFATSWIGPLAPEPESVPQVQPPSDGSIPPLTADDEDPEAQTLPEDAPEVRSAVDDYSWQELSQISALIADASSDAEALELAESYNLCGPDGELDGTQAKTLELTNGTEVSMRIAGFRQDEKADGSGAAGITFIAEDPLDSLPMDSGEDATSWEDTSLRAYLEDEGVDLLPEELADVTVAVNKTTNPVQGRGSQQVVTEDVLWVPSYSELVGKITGGKRMGAYESEGEQYQLFEDLGVTWTGGGSAVALSGSYWWLRSPEVTNSRWFMCVSPDGITSYDHRPVTSNAILVGFCL
ncbi:MAG TPA: zinc-ribbon domain-containing protein [Candidatus Olsenella pullicola]|nr:zinc-ribbon domain-containing protein [Candidatus Olsenella pullicola]